MEYVESFDSVSVEEPSNFSNLIFTDWNQFYCAPSTSFLKKPHTQNVKSRFLNSEVAKEINNDSQRKNIQNFTYHL